MNAAQRNRGRECKGGWETWRINWEGLICYEIRFSWTHSRNNVEEAVCARIVAVSLRFCRKFTDRATMETVTAFISLGSNITADSDCSHDIKRRLLLGRKDMTNLDSILKSRDITLPTKVHLVKATVFPIALYGCESWTIKKVEHWRTDAFELWCWRRLLRVPWTARSNQSILKEISLEYSLEELMLKLKHQYFGHLMQRTDSLEKILMPGKTEGRRRKGWQGMRWWWHHQLNGHEFEQVLGAGDGLGGQDAAVHGVAKSDRTELNWTESYQSSD